MSALETEFVPDAREATTMLLLRGRATYQEAPDLRRVLFDAISVSEGKNLVVELDEVKEMDTAAMAVLVEALMATRDGEPTLFLMCPSESVTRVFRLAGLEEALTRCYLCWEDLEKAIAV
jgi:anti-anti-sigma factor